MKAERRQITFRLAVVMLVFTGCSTALKPLGELTTQVLDLSHTQTTLEYRQPTFQRYECPSHGYMSCTQMIKEKPYCVPCLWERILEELK